MGWDCYCCICGNSCKGGDYNYLSDTFDVQGEINNKLNESEKYNKEIKSISKQIKWIYKTIMLCTNNINIKNSFYEAEDYLPFKLDLKYDDYNGIFLHLDCWKFVKINYQ